MTRRGDERVHRPGELLGVALDELQGRPVLLRRPLAPECKLRLGEHPGKRRPKLVRQLRREPLLTPKTCGETVQERVEGSRELGELIMGRAETEALVEILLAPCRSLPGHARYRTQRGGQHPSRHEHHEQEDGPAEDERADQRGPAGLLVRSQRNDGDDGSEAAPAEHGRRPVESDVRRRNVSEAGRAVAEAPCRGADLRARAWSLERAAVGEDPDLGVGRRVVGGFTHREPAVLGAELLQLRRRPRPNEVVSVAGKVVRKQDVEAGHERSQGRRNRGRDDEQQPAADSEPPHPIR